MGAKDADAVLSDGFGDCNSIWVGDRSILRHGLNLEGYRITYVPAASGKGLLIAGMISATAFPLSNVFVIVIALSAFSSIVTVNALTLLRSRYCLRRKRRIFVCNSKP